MPCRLSLPPSASSSSACERLRALRRPHASHKVHRLGVAGEAAVGAPVPVCRDDHPTPQQRGAALAALKRGRIGPVMAHITEETLILSERVAHDKMRRGGPQHRKRTAKRRNALTRQASSSRGSCRGLQGDTNTHSARGSFHCKLTTLHNYARRASMWRGLAGGAKGGAWRTRGQVGVVDGRHDRDRPRRAAEEEREAEAQLVEPVRGHTDLVMEDCGSGHAVALLR